MARTLVVVVSDDQNVIQRARAFGNENNCAVNVYGSKQWSEGLETPPFRQQLHTEPVTVNPVASGDAKILPFPGRSGPVNAAPQATGGGRKVSTINELEGEAILRAIVEYKGNLTEAARALGIGRATIYRKIKQYGIDPATGRAKPQAA